LPVNQRRREGWQLVEEVQAEEPSVKWKKYSME
jgi:hypothetical protein